MTMKQHSKTHVNKVLFKKVVNEFNHFRKNVKNHFCEKREMLENSFSPAHTKKNRLYVVICSKPVTHYLYCTNQKYDSLNTYTHFVT